MCFACSAVKEVEEERSFCYYWRDLLIAAEYIVLLSPLLTTLFAREKLIGYTVPCRCTARDIKLTCNITLLATD